MGRRAKKAPVQTKKKIILAKRFKCPFCANEDVVECQMKHRQGVGELKCRICDASFQMPIHHLHEPVDVFSEWLDECEAAEKRNNGIVDGGLAVGGSNDVDGVLAGAIGTGSGDKQAYDFDSDDDDDDDLLGTTSTSASGTGHKRTSGNNEASSSGQQKPQQTLQTLGVGDSDDDSY